MADKTVLEKENAEAERATKEWSDQRSSVEQWRGEEANRRFREAAARSVAGMGFARLLMIGALAVLFGNAAWALAVWIFAKLTAVP